MRSQAWPLVTWGWPEVRTREILEVEKLLSLDALLIVQDVSWKEPTSLKQAHRLLPFTEVLTN